VWARKARRLARYVGTLAAFEADRMSGFAHRPTSIGREHLEVAVRTVIDACPTRVGPATRKQGRLCAAVARSSTGAVCGLRLLTSRRHSRR
jgi:hypothetical protein